LRDQASSATAVSTRLGSQNAGAKQRFDLLSIRRRQRSVVNGDAKVRTVENGTICSKPLLAERHCSVEHGGVGIQQRR
jgi:hypothetical protein